jgi:hypothetical protein
MKRHKANKPRYAPPGTPYIVRQHDYDQNGTAIASRCLCYCYDHSSALLISRALNAKEKP